MRQIYIKPQIHLFETFAQFSAEFQLNKDDLILTEQFLYDSFIKYPDIPCNVICRDPFGLGEPSDDMIDQVIKRVSLLKYKRIIGVGGGSVMDIAKILALKENYPSAQLFSNEKRIQKDKTLILIPTTCGTGSEMTNLTIVNITARSTKLGIGNDELYADYSILIPQLVERLPYQYFFFSAVDAFVHAAESYVAIKSNLFTRTLSQKAIEMIIDGFCEINLKGKDARKPIIGNFLTASCLAGIAFGNTGVGPVHALAYPLGGNYHIPHGEAIYQFFTEVFKIYFHEYFGENLQELGLIIGRRISQSGLAYSESEPIAGLSIMLNQLYPLKPLKEYGMSEAEIESFSQSVVVNQKRLLVNSPINFTYSHAKSIYQARF